MYSKAEILVANMAICNTLIHPLTKGKCIYSLFLLMCESVIHSYKYSSFGVYPCLYNCSFKRKRKKEEG